MTAKDIAEVLHREPFEPFRIVTSSGQGYDVTRRKHAILTKGGLVAAHGASYGDLPIAGPRSHS